MSCLMFLAVMSQRRLYVPFILYELPDCLQFWTDESVFDDSLPYSPSRLLCLHLCNVSLTAVIFVICLPVHEQKVFALQKKKNVLVIGSLLNLLQFWLHPLGNQRLKEPWDSTLCFILLIVSSQVSYLNSLNSVLAVIWLCGDTLTVHRSVEVYVWPICDF